MTLPRLGTPTADDIDLQLRQRARLNRISRVLKGLGLQKLEDTPDVGLTNFKTKMAEDPGSILGGLRRLGRTPDSETFLRSLKPEIDEDGLTTIFGKLPPVSPVSERVTAPFKMPEPIPISRLPEVIGEPYRPVQERAIREKLGVPELPPAKTPTREEIAKQYESYFAKLSPETDVRGNLIPQWQRELSGIGMATTLVAGGAQLAVAGWRALTNLALMRQVSRFATDRGVAVSQEEAQVFANTIRSAAQKGGRGWELDRRALRAFFKPTGKGNIAPTEAGVREAEAVAQRAITQYAPAIIPKGTQTGAMAFGGLPKPVPITKALWDGMPVAQRATQAQSAGLSGQVGSKAYETLTVAERTALGKVTPAPEVTKEEFIANNSDLVREVKGRWGITHFELKTRVGDYQKVGQITSDSVEGVLGKYYDALKSRGLALPKAEVVPAQTWTEAGIQPSMLPAEVAETNPLAMTSTEFNNAYPRLRDLPVEKQQALLDMLNETNLEETGVDEPLDLATFQQDFADTRFDLQTGSVWMDEHKAIIEEAAKRGDIIAPVVREEYKEIISKIEAKKEQARALRERKRLVRAKPISETETREGMAPSLQPSPVPKEAGGEGGLRPPLTTPPPETAAGGEGRQPPVPPRTASGIPDPPPSITPGPMAQNIIGLRTIQPGLTRQQTINNWIRRQFGKAYKKVGGRALVLEDALATPAIVERARVAPIIESQANDLAAKVKVKTAQTFKPDKQGRVSALAGIIPEVGAPTIQDIAARLPLYANALTPQELEVFSFLKESVQPYHDLMTEVGIELRTRGDVMEGGFYLPRSFATLEDADLPYKVGGGRGGMKKGFEKPAVFDSMAQGIEAGYKYPSLSDAVANYARGAGQRATDAHVVNYMKALTDDTGKLLGETPKIRMLRQHPEIARPVEEIKANLVRLKSNIGALTQRQMDVIDLWANDPDFADTSAVIISLQEGLSTMKAGTPPQTLRELRTLLKQNIDALKALKPSYDKAMRQAQVTPREQGAINVQILPGLQGRTFPLELANAINIVLNQEGPTTGRGAVVMNITNAFNALWAMGHATADLSAAGIQGLLLAYNHPVVWSKAFYLNVKTLFSDKVAGEYLLNFDAREKQAGRLTSAEWNRAGSRMSGEAGFLETIGVSEKIMNLPIIKQTNRAFSLFGDVARKEWNSSELRAEIAKGRTREEITASGDLEKISYGANVMTGWSSEGFGSSIGQTLLFAPRWLQSRLSTLTLVAKGLRPGATKDQAMARNAILKMVAFGTLITVAINAALDEETDFRVIVDGKRNPHFMRVKIRLESGEVMYVSLFGSWDSLVGMLTHIGTGRPLNAIRNMGSGTVAVSFDLITGRDYQWREVGSKPVDPVKLSQWILRSSVPYAWGDLPETYKLFAEGEVIPGTLRLGGEALGVKSYIEETGAKVQEGLSTLGKIDQTGLDAALKRATTDKASPAKIAEIKAKDWTYDITSLRRDIGDAIQNLSDEEIAKLEPIAIAYSEFSKQKNAYEALSDKEQKAYLKNNPDFVANRIFWSDNGLTEIPDLATAEAVTAKAQAHNIPLNMIPAFQLTDKGKERIPSNRELWKPYFDYYALPGNGGYLSYSQEQVDAGELPAKYLAEWQTFRKLKTDVAKTLFRKNHKEVSRGDWRANFRRANPVLDQWLQDNEGLKPLEKPAVRRAGGISQPSIALARSEGGRGGGISFPSRRKAKYPKFRRVAVSRGLSISAPSAPRI